jgi:hypothetical protein
MAAYKRYPGFDIVPGTHLTHTTEKEDTMSIKLLGIAGSLREKSTNRGLLRAAQASLPEGVSMEIAELRDIPFITPTSPKNPRRSAAC